MKVKEIMSKEIKSLSPEITASEALAMLEEMQISGLPVIDGSNKLVGMFTEKEALTAILPSYIEKVGRFIYEENPKAVKQKAALLAKMKVKDIMRRSVITVDENTTLCEVAHIMLTQKARRLPVLNKDKIVVGIISRGDVLKALSQE
jgi:CBS domain-containing protein